MTWLPGWYWKDGTLALAFGESGVDEEWKEKMRAIDAKLRDESYRRIGWTQLPNGRVVSTIWLALDLRYTPEGPPLIFETCVFTGAAPGRRTLDGNRYATEAEARDGHDVMVAKWGPVH